MSLQIPRAMEKRVRADQPPLSDLGLHFVSVRLITLDSVSAGHLSAQRFTLKSQNQSIDFGKIFVLDVW